ncbi:MAG: hypothetical protein Q9157_005895 [Trypethelium eluteriae]
MGENSNEPPKPSHVVDQDAFPASILSDRGERRVEDQCQVAAYLREYNAAEALAAGCPQSQEIQAQRRKENVESLLKAMKKGIVDTEAAHTERQKSE